MKMKQIVGKCLGLLAVISLAVIPIFAVSSSGGYQCQVSGMCTENGISITCQATCPDYDAHCIVGYYYVECGCSISGNYKIIECDSVEDLMPGPGSGI